MDKCLLIFSIAILFSLLTFSLCEARPAESTNHNSDFGGGEDLSDDIIVSDFSSAETLFASDGATVKFDATNEDYSSSYYAPNDDGVDIPKNPLSEL